MQTLGDVFTVILALAAIIVVPYKIARARGMPSIATLFMSSERERVASELVRTAAEPPDTDAVRTSTPEDDRTTPESPIISHKMSNVELIAVLSVQKDERGGYRFSANKIADFVGGTRAEVLAEIKAIRDPGPPTQYRSLNEHQQPI